MTAKVSEAWSKMGGAASSEKANQYDQVYSFTRGFQVLESTPFEHDAESVLSATDGVLSIPPIGDLFKAGNPARVKNHDATRTGPISWMVSVGYQGINNDESVVDVEWTDTQTTEPIDRDWTGKAIVTANKEQVEGLTMDIADQVVVIRRKFITINTAGIAAYRRSTNSDYFLGWPPGTARLVGFSAKNQFKYGAQEELWDVTARIQFREPYANTTPAQAWYKRWRHEGLLVRKDGVIQRARDAMGQEVTKPVLLKSDGTQETNENNAYFIHTQVYGSLPYSALGLL